jgi:hypothetical protein
MKYLVKAPFPVREIGTAMALLHPGHQSQDIIRLQGFQGQHHFQQPPDLRDRKRWGFFPNRIWRCQRKKWAHIHVSM